MEGSSCNALKGKSLLILSLRKGPDILVNEEVEGAGAFPKM